LVALVSPPGQLTADWIRGRRVPYLAPLSLFLWTNVFFFVIQSITGLGILTWPLKIHLEDDSIAWATTWLLAQHRPDLVASTAAYENVFNALESVHAKSLVIVMIPAFAVAVAVLLVGRREPFRNPLTFATHFFAFTLLWLSVLFPVLALGLGLLVAAGLHPPDHHATDIAVSLVECAVIAWYLYVALGTVFALTRARRAVTATLLVVALYAILKAYHVVVFATTLYSSPR